MIRNKNTVWNKANNATRDADKYVQLPKIANASLPTAVEDGSSGENEGGLAYDATNNALYFSDGSSWAEVGTGATGASKALSNLAAVAINTSLVSDADSTDDLGASSEYWANSYIDKMYVNATATKYRWNYFSRRHRGSFNQDSYFNRYDSEHRLFSNHSWFDRFDGWRNPYR